MVTKQAVPPIKLDTGSARKTPFTEGEIHLGRRMVRGANNNFAENGKKDGIFCFSQSLEDRLPGKLKRHHEKAEIINLHGGNRRFHQIGLRVKDMDEENGK